MRALQAESGARIVVDKYGDQHADEKTLTIHGRTQLIPKENSLKKVTKHHPFIFRYARNYCHCQKLDLGKGGIRTSTQSFLSFFFFFVMGRAG